MRNLPAMSVDTRSHVDVYGKRMRKQAETANHNRVPLAFRLTADSIHAGLFVSFKQLLP
jgi:hypothetical protein